MHVSLMRLSSLKKKKELQGNTFFSLFYQLPICKRQLESFLYFVCCMFFLKYHRFEYENVPFFW